MKDDTKAFLAAMPEGVQFEPVTFARQWAITHNALSMVKSDALLALARKAAVTFLDRMRCPISEEDRRLEGDTGQKFFTMTRVIVHAKEEQYDCAYCRQPNV